MWPLVSKGAYGGVASPRPMVQPARLRRRKRLRRKDLDPVLERLAEDFGMSGFKPTAAFDEAEVEHEKVYLVNNRIVAFSVEGKVAPGLRGLLAWPAQKRWVTVDMGAVRFVTNGADIMAPGITEVDPEIREGDVVWIRDETHGRPLAVGLARVDAAGLTAAKGKVVRNVHTIGDALWQVGDEQRPDPS